MDSGGLVPDDLVVAMVAERLVASRLREGFHPRRFSEDDRAGGGALAELAQEGLGRSMPSCTSKSTTSRWSSRLSGRRICRQCKEGFHVEFMPPKIEGKCDKCGGELYQRDDDKPETIRQRLKVYYAQTADLIKYYRRARASSRRSMRACRRRGVLADVEADARAAQVRRCR